MMKKPAGLLLSLTLGLAALPAHAQDLETLLEGESKASTDSSGTLAANKRSEQQDLVEAVKAQLKGRLNSEQNLFVQKVEAGAWGAALTQYQPAFAGTSFEKTENGRALKALLLFQSGMATSGLEELFGIREVSKINAPILKIFKNAAAENHPAWKLALIEWNQGWTEFFGLGLAMKSQLRNVSHKQKVDELKALASKAPADSSERALVQWHLGLAYSLSDQPEAAAKTMALLLKGKTSPVSSDLLNLTAARLLYQSGFFEAALKYYGKINKNSDYWLDAQEEMAWSYIRKGEPQNALAVTETLVNPVFKGQVGAESYFLRALAQLKVCDYPGVAKSLELFPKTFKDRHESMKKLMVKADSEAVLKALDLIKKQTVTWQDLGSSSRELPRMMTRDQRLRDLALAQMQLGQEAKVAEDLYARSLAQTGLQSWLDRKKQVLNDRSLMARTDTMLRVQELAKRDVEETRKILDKMHIIEAELIQQTSMVDRIAKAKTKEKDVDVKVGSTGSTAEDVLRFPVDSNEVWFDELSNYKVNVKKACQVKR